MPIQDYQYTVLYAEKDYLLKPSEFRKFEGRFNSAMDGVRERVKDRCYYRVDYPSTREIEEGDIAELLKDNKKYAELVSNQVSYEEAINVQEGRYPSKPDKKKF